MSTSTRTRRTAASVIVGTLAFGGLALAAPASAQPKPPEPKSGCTYAGSSYSDGSTRQQVKNYSNGTKVYENYECRNGSWVYTGTSRTVSTNRLPDRAPLQPPANG
jgi:hypothetical protein